MTQGQLTMLITVVGGLFLFMLFLRSQKSIPVRKIQVEEEEPPPPDPHADCVDHRTYCVRRGD